MRTFILAVAALHLSLGCGGSKPIGAADAAADVAPVRPPHSPCGPYLPDRCSVGCPVCDGDGGWTCESCPDASSTSADDTLPTGWTVAQMLPITQTLCPSGGNVVPSFAVAENGDVLDGRISCVGSRISQRLCGYVVDGGATTRVLVQPCDLHPTVVPKGNQTNDVTFKLPARAGRTTVEIYDRFDFYGATSPPVPRLLGTAWVGQSTGVHP
jgi:hypothetical protein